MSKTKKTAAASVERFTPEITKGLTEAQVAERNAAGLHNNVKTSISKSYLTIIVKNLFTFFNLLCIICFVILVSVGAHISNFVFVIIYFFNSALAIFQEIKAKHALDKLSIVNTPTAKAIRDGKEKQISVQDVVLDDIIVLGLGNQIPADCVVLDGKIDVNESLLTGESVSVAKSKGDELLMGSFVTSGSCVCRVEKVGYDCYVQKMSAEAKKLKSNNSKLLNSINAIIKTVGVLIFPIAGVMGLVHYNVFLAQGLRGAELAREVATRTVAVVVGMIPAGMFLLTTMALAVGVIKMFKLNTLVQDLYSLEMLARVDVLCLDKTGTITDGQMAVKEVIELCEHETLPIGDAVFAMQNALPDNNQTSNALRLYFTSGHTLSPLATIPFSSERKYSAVTFAGAGTYVLGAPNYVFDKLPEAVSARVTKHTSLGRRVILLAHSAQSIVDEKLPDSLSPIALIVLEDNIRKEAIQTIAWFRENGVQVKVISGDDPITVSEISKRAGIENAENYINLTGLAEEEILNIAGAYTVFGRVSPEQKAILIRALKSHGHTVAMTGDGVNDILAMKEADCSVTVASGTGAAKSVANLVLLDNNFNSMPRVVAEGRRVINNIQQSSSLYLMKTLFTITFAILSIISVSKYPYTPGMMIMLEFFIIGLPSFVLSLQPNDNRVEGNFIASVMSRALPGAMILVLNVFIVQLITNEIGLQLPEDIAQTMAVVILTFGGWVFLVKLCAPADAYRGVLVTGITVVLFLWVSLLGTPLLQGFFGLKSFSPFKENWQYILIIICIIQFDFPLLTLFNKLMDKILKAGSIDALKHKFGGKK